jgi:hypothetical protein
MLSVQTGLETLTSSMQLKHLAWLATSLLSVRSAAADPTLHGETTPQSWLPNVLSTAAGTSIDARLDYVRPEDVEDVTIVSFAIHAQHLTPSGAGGYLTVPFAYISSGDEGASESETEIGNLELGGLYAFRGGPGLDTYGRVGFAIDTASGDLGFLLVPLANFTARPTDWFTTGYKSNWLRAGGGARARSGSLVYGGSASVDVPIGAKDQDDDLLGKADFVLLALAGSAGISEPGFGLTAGVSLVQTIGSEGDDENYVSLNIAFDVPVGPARLVAALGYSFERGGGASFGLGVRAGL